MRKCRDMLAVAVTLFVVTGVAQADLMPVSNMETGLQMEASVSEPSQVPATPAYDLLLGLPGPSEWAAEAVNLPVGSEAEEAESNVQVLIDRSDSVDLCLYALIGLGVLRSGHWVRRSTLGCIPEWYHTGGPDQIGHSHAIGPDCRFVGTVCFVQPAGGPDALSEEYHRGLIAPLLRKSQLVRAALASRGPPCMS